MTSRLRMEVYGAVQGVGFRPFVFRLAEDLGLAGWVINDTRGVFVEVEGPQERLEAFRERLVADKPPRSEIHSVAVAWLDPAGFEGFEIRRSDPGGEKTVVVLPDIATCDDCLAEVLDPADRRYRYPFTNCTNCGPRFTIIEAAALRPAQHHHARLPHVRRLPRASTRIRATAASTPSPTPARCAGRTSRWSTPAGRLLAERDDALERPPRAAGGGPHRGGQGPGRLPPDRATPAARRRWPACGSARPATRSPSR